MDGRALVRWNNSDDLAGLLNTIGNILVSNNNVEVMVEMADRCREIQIKKNEDEDNDFVHKNYQHEWIKANNLERHENFTDLEHNNVYCQFLNMLLVEKYNRISKRKE